MAVNVGQRNVPDTLSNRKCYAVFWCNDLCVHTLRIMSNKSVLESPHIDVAERIRILVMDIFASTFTANKIDIRSEDITDIHTRSELQNRAVNGLYELLGYIPIASKLFQMRKRKREYWTRLAKEALTFTKAWRESERKKFEGV